MPIFFEFINSMDLIRLPTLAVKRFARFSKILELAGDDLQNVSIGDILLRVNGESFRSYYEKNKWMANGANEFGGMRSVADDMTSRSGLLTLMPEEDYMVFELFSVTKMRSYTVKFPWLVVRDNACFLKTHELIHNLTGAPIPRVPSSKGLTPLDPQLMKSFRPIQNGTKKGVFYQSVPLPYLREALFPREAKAAKVVVKNTTDPDVDWAIYNKGESNMGIIYLRSFVPVNDDAEQVLLLIRSLLVNELKDTDSLLFDVRNNGGGLVTMADGIPQFFIKDFVNPGFRALVSPINENIFLRGFGPDEP
jgi:hypothetical protein